MSSFSVDKFFVWFGSEFALYSSTVSPLTENSISQTPVVIVLGDNSTICLGWSSTIFWITPTVSKVPEVTTKSWILLTSPFINGSNDFDCMVLGMGTFAISSIVGAISGILANSLIRL